MRRAQKLAWAATALGSAMVLASLGFGGQQPPQGAQEPGPGAGMRPRGERVEERLERLSKALNLTEDQKEKIKPILQDQFKQRRALREDTSLTPEQRREKAIAMRKAHRREIARILTPEQREKWKQMREEMQKRREERRENRPGAGPGSN